MQVISRVSTLDPGVQYAVGTYDGTGTLTTHGYQEGQEGTTGTAGGSSGLAARRGNGTVGDLLQLAHKAADLWRTAGSQQPA